MSNVKMSNSLGVLSCTKHVITQFFFHLILIHIRTKFGLSLHGHSIGLPTCLTPTNMCKHVPRKIQQLCSKKLLEN